MICSKCQTEVKFRPKSYSCSCATVWKEIAGKRITENLAAALFEKGETEILDGFCSKAGKTFSAALVLESGKVTFKYPESLPIKPEALPMHIQPNEERHPKDPDKPLSVRIESRSAGSVSLEVPGIIHDTISYGLVPSRQAECLGCITVVNLIKHSLNPLPKLELSLNSMEFARYLLREHLPRNAEVKRALEYLRGLLAEFPGWSAEYDPRKKAKLRGSPQSDTFPKGIFPGITVAIEEQGDSLRVALPHAPDVHAQFAASIHRAEKIEEGCFMVPKTAESVVRAWSARVGSAEIHEKG